MLNAEDFKKVVEESGLTLVEIAKLYGVSRQSIHYWRTTGLPRAGSPTDRMAETVTKAILNAVARKILPLASMSKEARTAKVASMARTLQNLKPAPVK